jgi:hypothetical protein
MLELPPHAQVAAGPSVYQAMLQRNSCTRPLGNNGALALPGVHPDVAQ